VLIKLIGVGVMAFVTAFIFKEFQSNAALELLLAKKTAMIACGPGVPNLKGIGNVRYKNHDPLNKDRGNGCAYQQAAGALCSSSESKRRLTKSYA
jgi:hypothetical protein